MSAAFRRAMPFDAEDLALILREMAVHYRQEPLAEEATLAAARRWLADESPAYPHLALAYGMVSLQASPLSPLALLHSDAVGHRTPFVVVFLRRDKRENEEDQPADIRYEHQQIEPA
jgi:hypothetical protein